MTFWAFFQSWNYRNQAKNPWSKNPTILCKPPYAVSSFVCSQSPLTIRIQARSSFSLQTPIDTYKRYKITSSHRQAVLVPEKRERKKPQLPYPTSSRYIRLMRTSPRRFRKYIADAATGILPCSCYSTISSRSCWSLKPPLFFSRWWICCACACALCFSATNSHYTAFLTVFLRVSSCALHPGFRRLLPSWESARDLTRWPVLHSSGVFRFIMYIVYLLFRIICADWRVSRVPNATNMMNSVHPHGIFLFGNNGHWGRPGWLVGGLWSGSNKWPLWDIIGTQKKFQPSLVTLKTIQDVQCSSHHIWEIACDPMKLRVKCGGISPEWQFHCHFVLDPTRLCSFYLSFASKFCWLDGSWLSIPSRGFLHSHYAHFICTCSPSARPLKFFLNPVFGLHKFKWWWWFIGIVFK
jgi:hypothetical protein